MTNYLWFGHPLLDCKTDDIVFMFATCWFEHLKSSHIKHFHSFPFVNVFFLIYL